MVRTPRKELPRGFQDAADCPDTQFFVHQAYAPSPLRMLPLISSGAVGERRPDRPDRFGVTGRELNPDQDVFAFDLIGRPRVSQPAYSCP